MESNRNAELIRQRAWVGRLLRHLTLLRSGKRKLNLGSAYHEMGTAGIIITDYPNRGGDADRVIVTKHARTFAALWNLSDGYPGRFNQYELLLAFADLAEEADDHCDIEAITIQALDRFYDMAQKFDAELDELLEEK